jgi:hypothetical protein
MALPNHVWTAPWQELSDVSAALVGCGVDIKACPTDVRFNIRAKASLALFEIMFSDFR